MRLLLTADTVGGVWTFACELAGGLLDRGHEVLLVSFGRTPSTAQSMQAARLGKLGCFEYVASNAPLEWMPENRDAYTAGAPLLLQLCEAFRPDALLLSQYCFGALPISVPKVLVAHSDVLSWAEAVGKAPLTEDAWLHTYINLVQLGLSGADVVVAPTATMLACLQNGFRVDCICRVVSNGRSLPAQAGSPARKLQAVTAGRMWDPAKNLAMLLTAKLPLPLIIAGEEQSASVDRVGMTLVGQLHADAMAALLRESAVYLCCSLYEPFGLAALEAALCGCAVLAYDIASLREVWGEGALYFHDADSLTALLATLVVSPAVLKAAQARSVARAQRYSASAMAEEYLQAITAMVKVHSEAELAA